MCRVCLTAKRNCFTDTVNKVKECYIVKNPLLTKESHININVSYDGSWNRQGHSSHHGVGTIIELETGLVIDTHVMSSICHVCAKGPATTDDGYHEWHTKHTPVCQRNFTGSANSMEIEAAKIMFGKSEEAHNLRYTRILCD